MTRLQTAFDAIDRANAADPGLDAQGRPKALLYGQRMTAEQEALYPNAAEPLRIACRGQHIERWTLPRDAYPMDRPGYLAWRTEQGRRHAARVAGIMRDAGYSQDETAHAEQMLTKQGIKRDADVQALEDVVCFTFIRWYLGPFAEGRDLQGLQRIVEKTARKMSAPARAIALRTFDIPEPFATAFRG
ncbi:MAG: DUF4202 domain-containing protein [Paracoccus sp. (in: a-proteobacteria)]|uniref:DUF4202 domain-containing protein n=1 Tax=Paracoccus sp. TaxID=267 RepID=UPI0039E2C337